MSNTNLHRARKAKNDEFYTRYEDVKEELLKYVKYNSDVFKDKVILCPCDDPVESAFFKVFCCFFSQWKIKKLICTSYNKGGKGKKLVLDRDIDLNGDGEITEEDLVIGTFQDNDGDFRSDAITKLRDQCDIIVTNPPFSLWKQFMEWTLSGKKQFLVIGPFLGVTYPVGWPPIQNNEMWLGVHSCTKFNTPAGGIKKANAYWFTNLPHGKRNEKLELLTMQECKNTFAHNKGFDDAYIKYDNIDAIEVPKSKWIPSDYKGLMGVSTWFLTSYNPDQFEIVGLHKGKADLCPGLRNNSKKFLDNLNKQRGTKSKFKYGNKIPGYFRKDGSAKFTFARIIIRHKV